MIVTDSKVRKLYGNSLLRFLKKSGIQADIISFPQGEKNKTLQSVEKLANEMVEKGFDRKDAIISLGGGVVGDVASLLSATYMRGIPYIQIPTTLLSMVDSSVGGKTGVDLESGKNLLGTFTQAKAVFIDIKYLKTLSSKQRRSGGRCQRFQCYSITILNKDIKLNLFFCSRHCMPRITISQQMCVNLTLSIRARKTKRKRQEYVKYTRFTT